MPRAVGLGCMRLSTERDRDEAGAVAVIHAALDAGVTLLDTADAYCWDESEAGHNERLVSRALSTWGGDTSRVVIATKGGLTRPGGRWVADGRARHLAAACDASRRSLGVARISLYQLHAPDPRTPFSTSVRALAALKEDGAIERVGLCNVTVGQIEEARKIVDIDAVQIELSVLRDDNVLSGVVPYCVEHRIQLIAYRPFGGAQRSRKIARDPVLRDVASRHGATPHDIALAWLLDLSDLIVPIPGATRVETAASLERAQRIVLTSDDRAQLDERFPFGALVRNGARRRQPMDSALQPSEVVLIMGLPAAGKSTAARTFVDRGYARLNRDDGGGSLRGLLPAFNRLIDAGQSRIVLDNTYVSRKSRAALIQAAHMRDAPVRCVWLTTSVEDAQVNAVTRMIARYGRLLAPEEMRKAVKHDVSAFGPGVQFRYQRELEPPDVAEGFVSVETVPFVRERDTSSTNRALVVWCDGVLGRFRGASADVEVFAERAQALRKYVDDGWQLLGVDWHPEIADGSVTAEEIAARYTRLRDAIGAPIDISYCPHPAGPPICWCRKPLPGLGVVLIDRYKLDPAQCIYVGAGPQDPGFARRLGFQYREPDVFFDES